MKIAIASGKGGVGKSMLASSLAIELSKECEIVACDCDVDAPNLGIWLGIKKWKKGLEISTSQKAKIDTKKCTICGRCVEVCRFDAIVKELKVNPMFCEGCGACQLICPVGAIELEDVENGEINFSKERFWVVSGLLKPGESGSGKIVSLVKKRAEKFKHDIMVIDSAAGIGCPVIASVRDADFVVLVTEPTHASFSDMKRMAEVITHFKIPYGIIINMWDMNKRMTNIIIKWASDRFIGKIRHSMSVVEHMVKMEPIVETKSKVAIDISNMCREIKNKAGVKI